MGRVFLALAIFLLSGSHALADRFYAGADVRTTNIEDSVQGLSFQNRPIGFGLHAGYQFNHIFALEASYLDFGEAEDDVLGGTAKADLSGYVMSVVLQTDMTTPNLFTKIGYFNGEVDTTITGIPGLAAIDANNDEDGLAIGVGFRHNLRNINQSLYNAAIRGEVDLLESSFLDNVWSIGIGIEFSFGN